jgi:glycosyltransferase involved in cell wall biosynthesis
VISSDIDTNPALTLVLPLLDEEGNIESVADDLLYAFRTADISLTLILVDNGSKDGTRAKVEQLAAKHDSIRGLYLDKNAGYGGGIQAGMAEADTPLLGWMWGDAQIEAGDVVRVYRRLITDKADLSKARRVQRVDGWQRSVVTRVYNLATLWLFHVSSVDTNGCPKIFTRAAWEELAPKSKDWFLDPEVMIGYGRKGMKLTEVDVLAKPRTKGVSKVGTGTVAEFVVNLLRARAKVNKGEADLR